MKLQPGDIAACYNPTWFVTRCISYGTADLCAPRRLRIGPAHVAMICPHRSEHVPSHVPYTDAANLLWVESTTMVRTPCVIQRRRVHGLQAQQVGDRVQDYLDAGGRVDLYRLSPIDSLSTAEAQLLERLLIDHFVAKAVPYDMAGALLSGTRVLKLSRLFNSNLQSVFCSELLAAVLMRLHRMNRANPTRYNPASLVRELVRQGTYQYVGELSADYPPKTFPRLHTSAA